VTSRGSQGDVESATLAWLREKLEDPGIGPKDNFLEIGGHSLLAIELNTWLDAGYGRTLDVPTLFNESIKDAVVSAVPSDGERRGT
jgi:Phosphopantetheine attachment site